MVHCLERFVEDDDARIADQRGGEQRAPPLAHRQLADGVPRRLEQPDPIERIGCRCPRLAAQSRHELKDVGDRRVRRELGVLGHVRQVTSRLRLRLPEVQIVDRDRTGRWTLDTGDDAHQGALSGAVRADHDRESWTDVQRRDGERWSAAVV